MTDHGKFSSFPQNETSVFESPVSQSNVIGQSEAKVLHCRNNFMHSLTIDILETYKRCNPSFRAVERLPQRILTTPTEGVHNNGYDNEECNLICRVHDQLEYGHTKYTILDLLGTGTFGQVFRCQKDGTKEVVAVKVIKNKAAYHAQGLLEIKIAKMLNEKIDPSDQRHLVRLYNAFEFRGHICLVFELLSMSLLDILTQNQFRGLPLTVVQRFTRQIISALVAMQDANIIHCDLKPENILLAPPKLPPQKTISATTTSEGQAHPANIDFSVAAFPNTAGPVSPSQPQRDSSSVSPASSSSRLGSWSDIKVIDFGSACFEGQTMYSYIQSRFCKSYLYFVLLFSLSLFC